MYNDGGKVFESSQENGLVFLKRDWNGGCLPYDLVEQAGILATNFSLIDGSFRSSLGGYVKVGADALFRLEQNQFPSQLHHESEVFLASDLNTWNPFANPNRWRMKRRQNGWELFINWDVLAGHSPFAFKFVTQDLTWLEPCSHYVSVEDAMGEGKNYIFDSTRTGKDIFSFDIVKSPRQEKLQHWLQNRPEGDFGYVRDGQGNKFRLFAPRAKGVDLLIYDDPKGAVKKRIPLALSSDGSWEAQAQPSWEGLFYLYGVTQKLDDESSETFEKIILDPYARAVCNRGGPGIIQTHPRKVAKEEQFHPPHIKDLVIMEAHVRDLVDNIEPQPEVPLDAWFHRLTDWISSDHCYLKQTGVNAVEFQPIQEFDARSRDEYHWGYMPVNFFSPASTFSSDPSQGNGVKEFKMLVEAFHKAGIAVILDVVYNHVGVPGHLLNLDRELYFRLDTQGKLQNFSGCGNDLNCESEPTRKIVLDSLIYLVEVYDIDGFRFDLGELLGIELLSEIETELRKIKPSIALIAEPWSFRGRLPNKIKDSTFSLWSDECREKVFSCLAHHNCEAEVYKLVRGELDDPLHPWHSVNYIESHDDFSFVDRICQSREVSTQNFTIEIVKMNRLALFLVLFSPGVPMISAGQDFMRHKSGNCNTYQRGDLNALDYENFAKYNELSTEIQKFIRFRLSDEGEFLRPEKKTDCEYQQICDLPHGVVAIEIHHIKTASEYCILFNYTGQDRRVSLPVKWMESECVLSRLKVHSTLSIAGYGYFVLH